MENAFYTRDSNSYLTREATVRVCVLCVVCVRAEVHACMLANVCVYLWVCACKFSISPWATPTHSYIQ